MPEGRRTGPPYRAALVGLGRIADGIDDEFVGWGQLLPLSHMGAFADVPEVEVVGGADPDPDARAAFAARWGIDGRHLHASIEDLLVEEQPDIVSVCTTATPRRAIVREIVDAVQDGRTGVRAIWAEKPLAVTLADADEMVSACADAGILLVVNTQRGSDASFQLARALIDAGELGEIVHLAGVAQGNLSHNAVHMLASMCHLAGGPDPSGRRIVWVVGEVESDEKAAGDEDFLANAYLAFDNGARGWIRCEPMGSTTTHLEVRGRKGALRILDYDGAYQMEIVRDEASVAGARPTAVRHPFPRPQRLWSGSVGVVRDIVRCLDQGTSARAPGDLGRHLLEVAVAIRESHRRGVVRVDLPIVDRRLGIRSFDTLGGGVKSAMRGFLKPASGPMADAGRALIPVVDSVRARRGDR